MKKGIRFLLVILIIIIIAISIYFIYRGDKTIENDNSADVTMDNNINKDANTIKNEKQLLIDVMNNEKSFINKDNNETLLKNFEIVENQKAEVQKYAFVDFDKDGIEELVIYTTSDYGAYVILHCEEEDVYGYMIEVRSLENLKADGSFTGSNGAYSTEYLRMTFDKNNYSINTEAIYDTTNKIYKINDNQVSLEEMKKYDEEWKQKEEVKWNS